MKKKTSTRLTLAIFAGLILGIVLGLLIPGRLEFLLPVIDLVSGLYMNALKMMIYPLVFCSLVAGIHGIGSVSATGRIGAQSVIYYTATTLLASLLGLFLPKALGLGAGVSIEMVEADVAATQFTSLLDTVKNLIPANPAAAFANGDMLQVLVFAVIVGITCLALGKKAEPFVTLAYSINEISVKIVSVVMLFTPVGVLCSIASVVYANGTETILALGTVLIALYLTFFLYAFIVYGGIVKLLGRYGVVEFFTKVMPAALNAFGTCSSSATLPISKRCADEMGVPNEVSSLALPLGATINMDGNALYQGIVALFVAQAYGMELSLSMQVMVVLTGTLASIGAAGVPGAGMIVLSTVLASVGLPVDGIALVAGIDRVLDMGRTFVNVTGDAVTACVVNGRRGTN